MIEVRPYDAKIDEPFLYRTWLQCYKEESYFAKRILKDLFFKWHRKVLNDILARPGTQILMACPRGEPEVILGYLAFEIQRDREVAVHFVFTKKQFRRMGIAKALFETAGLQTAKIFFSHWTYDLDAVRHKIPEAIYDPYRI